MRPAPRRERSETLGSGMLAEKETLSITINPSEAVESAAEESASA